jgi:putative tryptophan/tyrosine transport system substrate-binding protein
MRRREFLGVLGGAAAAWPLAARAQTPAKVRRVGVLMNSAANDPVEESLVAAFVEALRQLGWVAGRNLHIDLRWAAGDFDKFQTLSAELTAQRPDVILAVSNLAVTAIRRTASDIPVVFTQVSDPIGRGFVANLARPGGTITGFANFEASMGGKWLGTLKEIAPNLTRIALVFNPETSPHIASGFYLREAADAGSRLSVETVVTRVHSRFELESQFRQFADEPHSGVVVLPDAFTTANGDMIVALAMRLALPAIYPFHRFVSLGGLIYYGVDPKDQFPRAATYVDRILKGEKPADLPVQAPTRFELAVNLKVAKALGLAVPPTLLASADEVIE